MKQRAVDIVMEGTYMLSNWYDPQGKLRTFTCRATRVSPFRMMVDMPVVGKVGDNLISYFRDIGNFEGTISDTGRSIVLLELEMTQAMREARGKAYLAGEEDQGSGQHRRRQKDAALCPEGLAHHLDACRRRHSRLLRHRRLTVGSRRNGGAAAAGRNPARHRRLRRPRHPAHAGRIRRQVRQTAEPRRAERIDRAGEIGLSPTVVPAIAGATIEFSKPPYAAAFFGANLP